MTDITAKIKKNDIYSVEIISAGNGGEGVCRIDNFTVFVPYAVLGDKIDARIVKVNKSFAFGKIERVVTPSPNRIEAKCSVFGKCGGCDLQTTKYETQLETKRCKVRDALERIGGFKGIDVKPCTPSEPNFHYRNKAQYPVASIDGMAATGFYAPRSHRLVKADECPLTDSDSKKVAKAVIDFMNQYKIEAYNEETRKGCVRHIYTRSGDDEIIAVIVGATKELEYANKLVSALENAGLEKKLVGVVYNYNPKPDNVILGKSHVILYGRDYIFDTLCGLKFKINYKSFYQINKKTTEKLYKKAIELLSPQKNETVMDLYCGIGTITLCAAKESYRIIGVETVEEAIIDARENAKANGIDNAEFYVGDAEKVCPDLVEKGIKASAIIVDPPRKGCDKVLLETILKLAPSRVVYVSCDIATLARDAKFLCENGYTLTEAYPFDQFPQTSHVETVVLLSKGEVDSK